MRKYAQMASDGNALLVMISGLQHAGSVTDALIPVQHQQRCQSAGIIFIANFMDGSLHQASFFTGNGGYD